MVQGERRAARFLRMVHRLLVLSVCAMTRVIEWVYWVFQRLRCVVRGHDLIFHYDRQRLSLRCLICGYQTPGVPVGERPQPTGVIRLAKRERLARDHAA